MALFKEAYKLTRSCSQQRSCTSAWVLAVLRVPLQVQQQQLESVRTMSQALVGRHSGMAIRTSKSTPCQDAGVAGIEGADTKVDGCA
eukprot:9609236-Karenia_brevis.AAC.1